MYSSTGVKPPLRRGTRIISIRILLARIGFLPAVAGPVVLSSGFAFQGLDQAQPKQSQEGCLIVGLQSTSNEYRFHWGASMLNCLTLIESHLRHNLASLSFLPQKASRLLNSFSLMRPSLWSSFDIIISGWISSCLGCQDRVSTSRECRYFI